MRKLELLLDPEYYNVHKNDKDEEFN
jgi:hypothetical protein